MEREEALAALVSLEPVQRIMVADLKPSDVIVLECDGWVTSEAAERLKQMCETLWPGHKVCVLAGGLKLKFVQAEQVPT